MMILGRFRAGSNPESPLELAKAWNPGDEIYMLPGIDMERLARTALDPTVVRSDTEIDGRPISPNERIMEDLVARVETALTTSFGEAPRALRARGTCGLAPDVVDYCVQNEAKRRNYQLASSQYQLLDLHAAAAGRDPQDIDAFQHGFNVITVNGESFLADLSFAQFFTPDGRNPTNQLYESRVAYGLVTRGFMPLTTENLQEYLSITSNQQDPPPEYVATASLEIFRHVKPLKPDWDRPALHPDVGLVPH